MNDTMSKYVPNPEKKCHHACSWVKGFRGAEAKEGRLKRFCGREKSRFSILQRNSVYKVNWFSLGNPLPGRSQLWADVVVQVPGDATQKVPEIKGFM